MTGKRRETRRVKSTLSCDWGVTADCPRNGTITSISRKGCFVRTKAAVSEGAKLFLICRLPSRRRLPLHGQIVYRIPRVGFGLTFADLSERDRVMLDLLLDYYETEQPQDGEDDKE